MLGPSWSPDKFDGRTFALRASGGLLRRVRPKGFGSLGREVQKVFRVSQRARAEASKGLSLNQNM
jgi:hypothetical protein